MPALEKLLSGAGLHDRGGITIARRNRAHMGFSPSLSRVRQFWLFSWDFRHARVMRAKRPTLKRWDGKREYCLPDRSMNERRSVRFDHSASNDEGLTVSSPIRVLIVDDSAVIRRSLREIFAQNEEISLVGEASNGQEALEKLHGLDPHVVILDVNMPVMDGISALKHIMISHPKPTVMLSAYTQEGAKVSFDVLRYGAVDFIPKPSQSLGISMEGQSEVIRNRVRLAAKVQVEAIRYVRPLPRQAAEVQKGPSEYKYLFALGASVGGYSAFLKIIPQLVPRVPAAFLGVLYADSRHLDAFVEYLNGYSAIRVRRARSGEPIEGGTFYLAAGDEYLTVRQDGAGLAVEVNPSPFPHHRGSINMLMLSAVEAMGNHTVGIMLSGADKDGLEGIREILRVGGTAVVQDPRSCLCKEAPARVIDNCKVDLIVSDNEMARNINEFFA
jgi:two-component system chemotaxis response regulator CheB